MEQIHATQHYEVLQPADGSFRIRGRSRRARQILQDIVSEMKLNAAALEGSGAYPVRKDNPFELVRVFDRCEARMTLAEIEVLRNADDRLAG